MDSTVPKAMEVRRPGNPWFDRRVVTWGTVLLSTFGLGLWTWHLIETERGGMDGPLDLPIHFTAAACKIATILGLVLVLSPALMRRLHGNPARAILAALILGGGSVALLTAATLLRPTLEEILNSQTTRYIPASPEDRRALVIHPMPEARTFGERWDSGAIWWTEAGILLMFACGISAFGLVAGSSVILGAVWSALWTVALAVTCMVTGMSIWDFDFFYQGTVTGPLPLDLLFLPWPTVGTNILWPLYLWWAFAAALLTSLWRPPAPPVSAIRRA